MIVCNKTTAKALEVTKQQAIEMNKMRSKLSFGARGTYKYGGDGATITDVPTFKMNPDGSVSYRVVGERVLPYEKFETIGVGDLPERKRTIVSTGKITSGGLILPNKNDVTEISVKRSKRRKLQGPV